MAVGLDVQAKQAHALPAAGGLVQGGGQFPLEPFARHLQDVVDASVARCGLQVHAGAPVQVQNVAQAVDQCCHRGHLLQQRLFGQFAQRHFHARAAFA